MQSKIELPKRTSTVSENFFARDAETVARDMLGRFLVYEWPRKAALYANIREIAAYEGNQEESMAEEAMYAPGTLIVSTKHGKRLLDIATNKICVPSCVTLIAADIYDGAGFRESVQGAGNLTSALEIEKEDLNGMPLRLSPIWIAGDAIEDGRILRRKNGRAPKNCKGYFYYRN